MWEETHAEGAGVGKSARRCGANWNGAGVCGEMRQFVTNQEVRSDFFDERLELV